MRGQNSVTINGRAYDARSGLPVSTNAHAAPLAPARARAFSDIVRKVPAPGQPAAPAAARIIAAKPPAAVTAQKPSVVMPKPAVIRQSATPHKAVHTTTQKSQTLNRTALKRPVSAAAKPAAAASAKSPLISKFAPHPQFAPKPQRAIAAAPAAPAIKLAAPAPAKNHTAAPLAPAPIRQNSQLKEQLIKERIAEAEARKAEAKHNAKSARLRGIFKRKSKLANIATVSLAVLVLGGYLTYINLPNLSVRVAAARAGISATYPEYRPAGYSFSGPVAYEAGEVTLAFASNSNKEQAYQIRERASTWDSQAVLDNLVAKESGTYLTYSERGLTVYTYGQKAAWVNGGILYTLSGKAPLNSDQILKIASSM